MRFTYVKKDEMMLSERFSFEKLNDILVAEWHPFPTANERDKWEDLPQGIRSAYIARGEKALDFNWPSLTAISFLDHVRTGNRTRYQAARNDRRNALAHLVMAECVEGKGRFWDQIANGIWVTCEETYWGVPAHLRLQAAGKGLPDVTEPTVDLFAAETSALLSWTSYLLGSQMNTVSSLICPRIAVEVERRILTPLLQREDFGWMGLSKSARRVNNWNPWINSNWLQSALLIEKDRGRLVQSVAKSMRSLDQFIEPYPKDGGCDEGPGYWGRAAASLYDCLEILESATNSGIDLYDMPLLKNMGSFIYKLHIHEDYYVNFADAAPLVSPAASIIYRYGKRVGDQEMTAFGSWLAHKQQVAEEGFGDSVARQLPALFCVNDLLATKGKQPLPRDAWFPDIQVMATRSKAGFADGFFVAAKGGSNFESHNHNDVGNFVVFVDGKPLLIDTGVEPYTAKNASPQRYDIWTMSSDYHNVPQINGQSQQDGEVFVAKDVVYDANDNGVRYQLNIAKAYAAEAGVKSWMRTIGFERGKGVQIDDVYELTKADALTLHLMTASDVVVGKGVLDFKEVSLADGRVSGVGKIHFDADIFDVTTEEISLMDGEKLHKIWGSRVVRIVMQVKNLQKQGQWTLHLTK
ncbi:MAG: heparinase II/III domain-containing protein [Candidatus Latescibacterota bacterium]